MLSWHNSAPCSKTRRSRKHGMTSGRILSNVFLLKRLRVRVTKPKDDAAKAEAGEPTGDDSQRKPMAAVDG